MQANPKPDLFPSDRRNFPLKRLRAIVIKHQNDEQRGINFPAYISQIQTERRDSLGGTILPPLGPEKDVINSLFRLPPLLCSMTDTDKSVWSRFYFDYIGIKTEEKEEEDGRGGEGNIFYLFPRSWGAFRFSQIASRIPRQNSQRKFKSPISL